MSSRKEQKAQLKKDREAATAARQAEQKKSRNIRILASGAALAIVIVGALILVQGKENPINNPISGGAAAAALIGSAEQSGSSLGSKKAPVTISEYADLRCPACKAFSEKSYGDIINKLVKTNEARLQYNNWAILGPESVLAAKAALAAGQQNKGFLFAEIFYMNQRNETTPYVTDKFLLSIATEAKLDIAKWQKDRRDPSLVPQLTKISKDAVKQGFTGTPSLTVEKDGLVIPLPQGTDANGVIAAVNQVNGRK